MHKALASFSVWAGHFAQPFAKQKFTRVQHPTVVILVTSPADNTRIREEKKSMKAKALKYLLLGISLLVTRDAAVFAQDAPLGPSVVASGRVTEAIAPAPAGFSEDLTSISLTSSKLLKIDAVLGIKDGTPKDKFIREIWQVTWRAGDPIDLYIIRPADVPKPPVILYLYSYPDGTDRFSNPQWCEGVTSRGFAAVGFVSAYTGHRLEYHAPKKWFVSELQESLATTTHDVQMILNFLDSRADLNMSRVGMFGEGSGGAVAILASAADPRIKVVQVLGPWGDWPDWLAQSRLISENERAAMLKPEFLQSVSTLDPLQWLPKIKAESFRMETVETYHMVPEICTKKLEGAAPKTARVDDFGDSRAMILKMSSEGDLFGWIKTQLADDAKRTTPFEESERIHHYPAAAGDPTAKSLMAPPPTPPTAEDKPAAKP